MILAFAGLCGIVHVASFSRHVLGAQWGQKDPDVVPSCLPTAPPWSRRHPRYLRRQHQAPGSHILLQWLLDRPVSVSALIKPWPHRQPLLGFIHMWSPLKVTCSCSQPSSHSTSVLQPALSDPPQSRHIWSFLDPRLLLTAGLHSERSSLSCLTLVLSHCQLRLLQQTPELGGYTQTLCITVLQAGI